MINETKGYLIEQIKALECISQDKVKEICEALTKTSEQFGRIWSAGNGGSATNAAHFVTDLSKGCYQSSGRTYPAICINESMGIMTAWSNDASFDLSMAMFLETQAKVGDCFVIFSGSGNSKNLLVANKKARDLGLSTIAFLGRGGGELKGRSDFEIIVNSNDMQIIENSHLYCVHLILKMLS
jgi:D-sedoheptulose 7-phosphate isomerase